MDGAEQLGSYQYSATVQ
uniref:Uncharacterized protein n=1 Tax=Arundo donax TaxID=35708 RepID=A0A0A9FEZ4_ARUDO